MTALLLRIVVITLVPPPTQSALPLFGLHTPSLYWWEGKIEEAGEWICLAKAKGEDYQRIESLIKENHPYSVPEILATPVSAGNKAYLAWISQVTSP